ncbi:MAG: DNA polymerase III subunit gamma/tau [Treponema sp.]|nr:DNA polymerase III subunit gamma/tau [Treponema sp.]MDY5837693.1 DNA polymerase III subunit gamma/tau [Treponema sp.]
MAYEVTATRRRPQSFKSLVGQEFVAETLKNSIQTGKIANAYLFSGPRGCGKTSTARIMAKSLNCRKGPTDSPCGECDACREITAGSSLDVIEIDGASNNSVEGVRQIKDEVLFPPQSCRYKIYIIDEVHMLSNSAFNALLKTIEEPPPYCIFIFATTELQKVPATIKSRCQQFNFRLVPPEKVKEQLAQAAQELGIKANDEALYWIAREAGGSMRDSYTLFDQVAAFSDGEITYEKIRDKLGLVGVDRLNELFGLCVNGDTENALLKLDAYLQNGVSIEQLISNCTDYLRSLLLIKNGITKESLLGQSKERFSSQVISAWSSIQIERALSLFMQLYRDIRYSLNPRFEFELAVSRLCWLKSYVSAADVKKAVDQVKPLLQDAAGPRKIQVASSPVDMAFAEGQKKNDAAVALSSSVESSQPEVQPRPSEPEKLNRPWVPQFSALTDSSVFKEVVSQEPEEDYSDSDPFLENEKELVEDEKSEATPIEEQFSDYVEEQAPEENNDKIYDQVDLSRVNKLNPDEVKNAVVSELIVSDGMVASNLNQTFNWSISETGIRATTDNKFQLTQLRLHEGKVLPVLEKIYGKAMNFEVVYEEKKTDAEEIVFPREVEILRDTFRGQVMGYKNS